MQALFQNLVNCLPYLDLILGNRRQTPDMKAIPKGRQIHFSALLHLVVFKIQFKTAMQMEILTIVYSISKLHNCIILCN